MWGSEKQFLFSISAASCRWMKACQHVLIIHSSDLCQKIGSSLFLISKHSRPRTSVQYTNMWFLNICLGSVEEVSWAVAAHCQINLPLLLAGRRFMRKKQWIKQGMWKCFALIKAMIVSQSKYSESDHVCGKMKRSVQGFPQCFGVDRIFVDLMKNRRRGRRGMTDFLWLWPRGCISLSLSTIFIIIHEHFTNIPCAASLPNSMVFAALCVTWWAVLRVGVCSKNNPVLLFYQTHCS